MVKENRELEFKGTNKGNENQDSSGQNTGGQGGKKRKRKNKGKDGKEEHVSNVTGGDNMGEVRY